MTFSDDSSDAETIIEVTNDSNSEGNGQPNESRTTDPDFSGVEQVGLTPAEEQEKETFGFVEFRQQYGIAKEIQDTELNELIDLYTQMFESLNEEKNIASAAEYFEVAQKSKEERLRRMADDKEWRASLKKQQKKRALSQDDGDEHVVDAIQIPECPDPKKFKGESYTDAIPSIIGQEDEELSHMPTLHDEWSEEKAMIEKLHTAFDGGIHNVPRIRPTYETNDEVMFKLMKQCLEHLKEHNVPTNPDYLYYALYRMFPSHGNQFKFSDKFEILCKKFIDENPTALTDKLEPWRISEPEIEEEGTSQCPDCTLYLCQVHGPVFQAPVVFETGNYFDIYLPIVTSEESERTVCSFGPCWKEKPFSEVNEILETEEAEREMGVVKGYLCKHQLFAMEPTDSMMMLTLLTSREADEPFCDFVKPFEGDDIVSCRQAYECVLEHMVFPNRPRKDIGAMFEMRQYKDRMSAWSNAQRRLNKKSEEPETETGAGSKNGTPIKESSEDNTPRNRSSGSGTTRKKSSCQSFGIVEPMRVCLHPGPCEEAEDCVCRTNGTCFHLCKCDPDCPLRFPGCDCLPGKCRTNACQCWFAKFECCPTTCLRCNCSLTGGEPRCGNFALSSGQHPKVCRGPSLIPNAGNGLFIEQDVKKDTQIIEYVGEKVSDAEIERRGMIGDVHKCSYIFNLATGGGIDSKHIGNVSRYANHNDKDPNLYTRDVFVCGENRIAFYANRDIKAGEELTFDYRYSEEHKKQFFGGGDEELEDEVFEKDVEDGEE